ncbi:MAG: excinuclease ABC subunit UvrC [Lachnospiraceae bacterium]|nr:excinuclease ABC subunit UvrC [Lachnospiraceae bacterium]
MRKTMFNIEEELRKLPDKPGVYLMHDKNDTIIYVGKAVVLKNRVRQYFQSSRGKSPKIQRMVEQIAWFEYIVVDSEMEALILECNLIKEHQPKYNTMLKDDKHYPYIRVTVNEDYPRIMLARERKKDKAKYFGPYTSAASVHDSIDLLKKTYFVRSCNRVLPRDMGKERPCLYYHMGQCKAPCQGYISREEYQANIAQVEEFLNGNYTLITKRLEEQMMKFSEEMEFEKAAEFRDLLFSVKRLAEQQKADDDMNIERDIIAFALAGDEAVAQVFFVRGGKMVGREHFYLTGVENEARSTIMANFIKQFYSGTPHIPKELLLSEETEEQELLENWLTARRGKRVRIVIPKKGSKERLVELAEKNASFVLQKDSERIAQQEKRTRGALQEIADWLELEQLNRVEAFDISNTSGFENVASMVVFEGGKPKKADYRKFKTRTIAGPDDYASMKEVLTRRFEHAKKELSELKEKYEGTATEEIQEMGSFTRLPDLILMDGGKGQVNIALEVLAEQKLAIPVCGMVKDDNHRTRGLYYNNIEIPIDTHSEGFHLITRIQDETHRFAIEYHRSLRGKAQTHSILDDIPGVGGARRRALMKQYGSLDALKEAAVEELAQLPSMNRRAAQAVYDFFHKK